MFKLAQKTDWVDYAPVCLGHSIHFFVLLVLVTVHSGHLASYSWQRSIAVFKTEEVLETNEVFDWPLKVVCPSWHAKTRGKSVRQDVLGFMLVAVLFGLRVFVIMAIIFIVVPA